MEHLGRAALARAGAVALGKRIRVRWNPRLRTTAGLTYAATALVWLNPRLAVFGFEEIRRTLLHELAHVLAQHRANRRRILAHGPEWRQACADLGIAEEERCHSLALPRRRMKRRFIYKCPACAQAIKRVRPFRRIVACFPCCRRHASGRYDERFRLVKAAI